MRFPLPLERTVMHERGDDLVRATYSFDAKTRSAHIALQLPFFLVGHRFDTALTRFHHR